MRLRRDSPALALAAVLAVSLGAGWLVFARLVLPDLLPGWDEAAHALQGALIAHDLRQLDLTGFLFDSYRQVYWPPVHSWMVGGAFLLTGPSMEAARAVSVLAFVLLAPAIFLIARTVEPRYGVLAGSVAAALTLTSPGLIISAGRSMLEMPGLLALSLTMLIYCVLERRPEVRPRAYMLLGLATTLTYLVKSNYAILFIISFVLTKLIAGGFRVRLLFTKQTFYAALPVAVFCAIWFAYPPKAVSTWNALVNQPWGGEEATGFAGLLFYPRSIVTFAGSWWLTVLLCGGLAAAWRTRRTPGIGILAVLALTQFVIGELHHTKVARHILPMFPSMFVLAGVAAAGLWSWFRSEGRGGRVAAFGVLASVALLHAAALNRYEWRTGDPRQATGSLRYISTLLRENPPALVVSGMGAFPGPPVLDWHLVAVEDLLPVTASGSAMDPRQERRVAGTLSRAPIPEPLRASAMRVFGRYDAPSLSRSLHAGNRLREDQAEFDAVLERTLDLSSPRAIIAMVAMSDTASYPASFIASVPTKAGFREVSVREFPVEETRVHLYLRP